MAEQKKAQSSDKTSTEEVELPASEEGVDTDAVDELLDAIDDVLEDNAEEFVANFVQRGGE